MCMMGTVLSEKGAALQPDTGGWRVQMLGSSQQQGGALSNSPMSSEGKAVAMSCLMLLYIIWIIITLRHTNHKSRAQKNEDDPCVQRAGWWGRMKNAPVLEERKRSKYWSVISVLFMQGSWNRLVTLTRFKKSKVNDLLLSPDFLAFWVSICFSENGKIINFLCWKLIISLNCMNL